mgnify:CR=1 FL=1
MQTVLEMAKFYFRKTIVVVLWIFEKKFMLHCIHYYRPAYQCPRQDCDIPMLEHIRRFVHESGSLYLIVKKIHDQSPDVITATSPEPERRRPDQEMTTWSWCRKCGLVREFLPMLNDCSGLHLY